MGFTKETAVEQAIQLSLQQHGEDKEPLIVAQPKEVEISSDQFTEVMKSHASSQISGEHRNIVVSRASIWATALPYFKRKKFAGGKSLIHVTFANFEEEEDAIDLGGPRHEFLHLLLGAICKDKILGVGGGGRGN